MILKVLVILVLEKFRDYNDEELIGLSRKGDHLAEEALIIRYTPYVRSFVRPYFLAGGDSEDLIQEGMIGVIKAISEFDEARHISFKTFAVTCIRNRVYSAIRSSMRDKNLPLNDYVPIADSDTDVSIKDMTADPIARIIDEESHRELLCAVSKLLSGFEQAVLQLYLEGLSYSEISERVSRQQKSVDNAVQRIRRKFAVYLKECGENG